MVTAIDSGLVKIKQGKLGPFESELDRIDLMVRTMRHPATLPALRVTLAEKLVEPAKRLIYDLRELDEERQVRAVAWLSNFLPIFVEYADQMMHPEDPQELQALVMNAADRVFRKSQDPVDIKNAREALIKAPWINEPGHIDHVAALLKNVSKFPLKKQAKNALKDILKEAAKQAPKDVADSIEPILASSPVGVAVKAHRVLRAIRRRGHNVIAFDTARRVVTDPKAGYFRRAFYIGYSAVSSMRIIRVRANQAQRNASTERTHPPQAHRVLNQ